MTGLNIPADRDYAEADDVQLAAWAKDDRDPVQSRTCYCLPLRAADRAHEGQPKSDSQRLRKFQPKTPLRGPLHG